MLGKLYQRESAFTKATQHFQHAKDYFLKIQHAAEGQAVRHHWVYIQTKLGDGYRNKGTDNELKLAVEEYKAGLRLTNNISLDATKDEPLLPWEFYLHRGIAFENKCWAIRRQKKNIEKKLKEFGMPVYSYSEIIEKIIGEIKNREKFRL